MENSQNLYRSIRTFLGAKDYAQSRQFYSDLGFEETVIGPKMCLIKVSEHLAFYLQDYYVKDWVNNCMIFLEVNDLDTHWDKVNRLDLPKRYKKVRLSEIKIMNWGREYFLHDPSGNLWHFGNFESSQKT